MRLGDRGRERQPEACSPAGAGLVGTPEALECMRQEVGREAFSLVEHVELDVAVSVERAQVNGSRAVLVVVEGDSESENEKGDTD
jgi:hypothetical protein